MFGPLKAQRKNSFLEVKVPRYLRDKGWADSMGHVQSEICQWATDKIGTTSDKVIFDLVLCRWVDPLPLMSILLEVANARHMGMNVVVRLPKPDSGPSPSEIGPYQNSPNRFLLYLDQEGFLDCLDSFNDKVTYYSSKPGEDRQIYKKLQVKLSYEDALCIRMNLFEVPDEESCPDFAKVTVERLLIGLDSKLESKVAPQTRERLIYKLRVALQEVLHNAQEHAYDNNSDYRVKAIYVRYRTGGLRLDMTGREIFQRHIYEERKWCPRLADDWLIARPGCLEVFVLDRGIGMVRSFENANIPLLDTYKFREVMVKTFYDGLSAKKERQTRYGGLHLLYNLLTMTSDYLRALEDGVWCGRGVPIIKKTMQHDLTKDHAKMRGLAMHFRLGWKEETDDGDKWAKFGEGEKSEVWPELKLHEVDCESSFNWFDARTIIDERFISIEEKVYEGKGDWILWLVRPHRMKWDIISYIERSITPRASGNTVLIIADIPSYEAETYAAALAEFKENIEINWPSKFSWIILSTNRWRFAAVNYQRQDSQHGFSKLYEDFTTLKIPTPQIKPKPANFRLAIVRWLKWHDSRRLWDEVHKRRSMFIPEQITWGKDDSGEKKTISGYLDFPQTTHNGLCAAIYRSSLARVLGVLPPNKVEMYPLDRLTLTVLRDIHAAEVYEPVDHIPGERLALGSVLVSGTTLDASVSLTLNLHFFVHLSSSLRGMNPSLLYWRPKDPVNEREPRLARIGKTATVAPEGWKSFEVPRFDDHGGCIGARSPEETYLDWQSNSPVIVKTGHWSYEGHHDFLTLNIVSAVEAAFLEKNKLARFLVFNILPFIGLGKAYVDENWHRLLEDESGSNTSLAHDPSSYGLMIYRSHPSSESIVRKLLDVLTPEGREVALTRVFPVLPIRMRQGGSTLLIPPLVREDIRKALNTGDRVRNVLLFDDAAITGRTLSDLRAALSAIGAKEIKTIVIANRLRQPADGYGEDRLNYYWRLDLPIMGGGGNCPLCHALHLAEAFAHSLVTENALKEIKEWKQRWGEISPLDNWSGGLRPLPLMEAEKKEYCYRQNLIATGNKGTYLAKIDLIRSTGMAIYVSELHAMTGRDDHCLKKIKEHSEPEIRVELAASQLLLFGNEFDIDIRVELIQALIRELPRFKKDSPYASLAALASIAGLGQLDEVAKLQAAKTVDEDGWASRENYATSVLLAHLVSEKLIDPKMDAFEIGKRLLSTDSWSLAQRLSEWYLEILSPSGNAHSEAIPILIDELKQFADELKVERVFDALDSLDHLDDIVSGLERGLVRKKELDKFVIKAASMSLAAEKVRKLLAQKLNGAKSDDWRENAQKALEDYITSVKLVADAYFYRIPSAENYCNERVFETKALSEVINKIVWKRASDRKIRDGKPIDTHVRIVKVSMAGVINFDNKAGEVWIAWHHGIYSIVLDLLRNAVYATSQIADPWDTTQQDKADLWIKVDYDKESVILTLANASESNSDTVFSELKNHRWPYLRDLGGIIEPVDIEKNDIEKNIVGIRISIPYAAFLRSEKEEIWLTS